MRDTELVAAYALSADDIFILKCSYGCMLLAIEQIEVVFDCIGEEWAVIRLMSDIRQLCTIDFWVCML